MTRVLIPLLWLLLGGCVTSEILRPIRAQAQMRLGRPSQAWEVLDERGTNVGLVVLFEAKELLEPTYMVRNQWHQDLGRVDQLGRAFRYVPHAKEAAWVGSGPLLQGVERILKRSHCQLIEMPFEIEARPTAPGQLETRRADGFGFRTQLPQTSIEGTQKQGTQPPSHPQPQTLQEQG